MPWQSRLCPLSAQWIPAVRGAEFVSTDKVGKERRAEGALFTYHNVFCGRNPCCPILLGISNDWPIALQENNLGLGTQHEVGIVLVGGGERHIAMKRREEVNMLLMRPDNQGRTQSRQTHTTPTKHDTISPPTTAHHCPLPVLPDLADHAESC